MIEVLTSGATNTVQDGGRYGYQTSGVCVGGAMDKRAFLTANALVGNHDDAALIEISLFPFRLRFRGDYLFCVTGATSGFTLDDRAFPPMWTMHAKQGQTLIVPPPTRGARAYLAIRGGIEVPEVLGSRSTDLKSAFGGVEGRGLKRGDVLTIGSPVGNLPQVGPFGMGALPYDGDNLLPSVSGLCTTPLRVIPAAEFNSFPAEAQEAFFQSKWRITNDANRMGYRLSGPQLNAQSSKSLLSHGIVPGTIQVPPSGQPIIQLVDANTCGGYAKIATVIEADFWRIAQSPVGSNLSFEMCDLSEAQSALKAQVYSLKHLKLAIARATSARPRGATSSSDICS